jgi:hypothetical protein
MDTPSWVTSEEQFDPFLSASWDSEEIYSDCCMTDHLCNVGIFISYFYVEFMFHVGNFKVKKLFKPPRVSAASLNDSRSQFAPI